MHPSAIVLSPGPCTPVRGRDHGSGREAMGERDSDPRRVPRTSGDRRGVRRRGRSRGSRDARKDVAHHARRHGTLRWAPDPARGDALPLAHRRAQHASVRRSRFSPPPAMRPTRSRRCATCRTRCGACSSTPSRCSRSRASESCRTSSRWRLPREACRSRTVRRCVCSRAARARRTRCAFARRARRSPSRSWSRRSRIATSCVTSSTTRGSSATRCSTPRSSCSTRTRPSRARFTAMSS